MEKFRVGIIGATGMVGQRFVLLTANHPWFTPVVLAASTHSAGKTYAQALGEKWHMADPIPESVKSMIVMDAEADAEEIAKQSKRWWFWMLPRWKKLLHRWILCSVPST